MSMKKEIKTIVIAKDDLPLEQFANCPITNFLRRLLYGKYLVCEECWKRKEREMAKERCKMMATQLEQSLTP